MTHETLQIIAIVGAIGVVLIMAFGLLIELFKYIIKKDDEDEKT